MPLLTEFRSLFTRKRKVVAIDLSDTQASGLTSSCDETALDGHPRLDTAIEPKPVRRGGDAARSYEEVLGLVHRIGEHLESQSARTERLLGLMDRLPQALEALPEINRQNAHLLDALHEHFSHAKGREETLNSTLSTLGEASGRQTEVLGLIQQQVESSSHASAKLTDTLGSLQGALRDLAESNVRSTDVLARMAEVTSQRDVEITDTLMRTQKWLVAIGLCCGAASVTAIVIAAIAMVG